MGGWFPGSGVPLDVKDKNTNIQIFLYQKMSCPANRTPEKPWEVKEGWKGGYRFVSLEKT